jgi:hypothetical protein
MCGFGMMGIFIIFLMTFVSSRCNVNIIFFKEAEIFLKIFYWVGLASSFKILRRDTACDVFNCLQVEKAILSSLSLILLWLLQKEFLELSHDYSWPLFLCIFPIL